MLLHMQEPVLLGRYPQQKPADRGYAFNIERLADCFSNALLSPLQRNLFDREAERCERMDLLARLTGDLGKGRPKDFMPHHQVMERFLQRRNVEASVKTQDRLEVIGEIRG